MHSVNIAWLGIDRSGEDRRNFICPGIRLLLKIMKEHCHKIMALTIQTLPASAQLYSTEDIQAGTFTLPELRELRLPIHNEPEDEFPPTLLEDVMAVAPKLDCLEATLDGKRFEKFPTGKCEILKRFVVEMFKTKYENTYHSFALTQPKLFNLRISQTSRVDNTTNFKKWMETLKLIFQSSSSYLEGLLIDSCTLSLLIKYQLCMRPLEELETLEIATGIVPTRVSPTRKIISKLNFSKMFPKVKKVTVFARYPEPVLPPEIISLDINGELIELDDASLSTHCIKQLVITGTQRSRRFRRHPILQDPEFLMTACSYWSQLFPHITSLTARVPLRIMWSSWPNLEKLRLNMCLIETVNNDRNFDSIFCGIHPKEVKLLRRESGDFLRRVHLVTWPSVAHLRSKLDSQKYSFGLTLLLWHWN